MNVFDFFSFVCDRGFVFGGILGEFIVEWLGSLLLFCLCGCSICVWGMGL